MKYYDQVVFYSKHDPGGHDILRVRVDPVHDKISAHTADLGGAMDETALPDSPRLGATCLPHLRHWVKAVLALLWVSWMGNPLKVCPSGTACWNSSLPAGTDSQAPFSLIGCQSWWGQQVLVWDATCPDTLAPSYTPSATREMETVAGQAEERNFTELQVVVVHTITHVRQSVVTFVIIPVHIRNGAVLTAVSNLEGVEPKATWQRAWPIART